MTTRVREGYNIRDFLLLPVNPDDALAGSEVIGLLDDGCPYVTLLPFPPNQHSPKGYVVLLASPYPVTVDEAKELQEEWSKEMVKKRKK